MPTRKYGSFSEQDQTAFRASNGNQIILDPGTPSTGVTLTLPDPGVSESIVSRTSLDTGANRLQNKSLDVANVLFVDDADVNFRLSFQLNTLTSPAVLNIPDVGTDNAVTDTSTSVLTNKTLGPFSILDAAGGTDNVYNVVSSEIAADRNITLPALTGNDTFAFTDQAQTFLNKSIDANQNTITNIANAEIQASASIALNKLAAVTANSALESDASGFIVASAVTSTELNYLDGVTSNLQVQLDGKASTLLDNLTVVGLADESLLVGVNANSVESLAVGANGQVLSVVSGSVAWANPAGTGDVTSANNINDNSLVRGDGGAKGIQQSGILVDDNDNISGSGFHVHDNTVDYDFTISSGESAFHSGFTITSPNTVTVASGGRLLSGTVTVNSGATLQINGSHRIL